MWFDKENYRYRVKLNFPDDISIDMVNKIGEGSGGVIYGGKKGNKDIICKFQILDSPIPTKDCLTENDNKNRNCLSISKKKFKEEIKTAKLCASLKLSPKVYYTGTYKIIDYTPPPRLLKISLEKIPKYVGIIIMERYGVSLLQYIKSDKNLFFINQSMLINQYLHILKKLYKKGYTSHDNHFGNIVVDPSSLNMKFIDIDLSRTKMKWEDIELAQIYNWDFQASNFK